MAGPFDDQLILDVTESVTYANLAGTTVSVAAATVDEEASATQFPGYLSFVAWDAMITIGRTQLATRPEPGGTITDADGYVWQIVSVVKRKLGYFWEIVGRQFNRSGGLTQTGTLSRRTNTPDATSKLSEALWTPYSVSVPCLLMPDAQGMEMPMPDGVKTMISAKAAIQGYREMRAGDRFVLSDDATILWTVQGSEPYDPSLGVQNFQVIRPI